MVSNAGQSLNLGSAYAEVILAAKIDRSLRDIDRTLGQSLQNVGDQVTNLGGALTKLTAPITAFGATGISTFARFDDTLTEISARTGTFGAELDLIREKALELGADTVFSSQQVLDAFLDLTSSGQTVAEAMVTLEDVTTLAAAGNLELGRAADLTTDLMSVFSLELEQSGEIADALARGAGSSSASVAQLGEALINGGPVAAQFGLSLDETTAILAVFAEAGIKGSEAGTQLRSMLLNMGRDTDTVNAAWKDLGTQLFDSEGNIRNLNDVVMDINSGLENLTEEEGTKALTALAGSYGIVGLRALLAADGITEMEARMLAQVDAATVAQQQMSSLGNRLGSLRGSIETLQITLFGLNQGPLTDFIDTLINAVNRVTQFARENPELAQTIFSVATAAAAAGPALIVLGQVITSIGVVAGVVFSPLGLVAGTILAIAGAIAYAYRQNLGGFADALHEIGKGVRLFVGRFRETGNVFDAFRRGFSAVIDDVLEAVGVPYEAAQAARTGFIAFVDRAEAAFRMLSNRIATGFVVLRMAAATLREQIEQAMNSEFARQARTAFVNFALRTDAAFKRLAIRAVILFNTLREALATFRSGVGLGVEPLKMLRAVIVDFGPRILMALGASEEFANGFTSGFLRIWDVTGRVVVALREFGGTVITFFRDTVIPGFFAFVDAMRALPDVVRTVFGAARDTTVNRFNEMREAVVGFGLRALDAMQPFFDFFMNVIGNSIVAAAQIFIGAIGGMIEIGASIWSAIGPVLLRFGRWWLADGLPAVVSFIRDVYMVALNAMLNFFQTFWGIVQPLIQPLVDWFVSTAVPAVVAYINDVFLPVLQGILDYFVNLWINVQKPLQRFADWFTVTGLPAAKGAVDVFIAFVEVVFQERIATAFGAAIEKAMNFRDKLVSFFKTVREEIDRLLDRVEEIRDKAERLPGVIANALPGGGGNGGNEGGFWSQLGFANGGRPPLGVPFWVGERGKELMILDTPGTVIPNGRSQQIAAASEAAMGGASGGGSTFIFNIDRVTSGQEAEAERLMADVERKLRRKMGMN